MVTPSIQGSPVEERATALLLKSLGLLNAEGEISPSALQLSGEQFINPLQVELAGGMRVTFELPVDGGVGISCFDAIAVDAAEA
jgi:hypothetical protein